MNATKCKSVALGGTKKKKPKRPEPFGHPNYPAFDFHISHGTAQVWAIRGNAALYKTDFEKFKKWLDKVKEYQESLMGNLSL